MKIIRAGSNPSSQGPEDYFTGTVRLDPMFQADEPGRTSGAHVTFEPGARTAWHTHPLGQTLHVVSGVGLIARRGGPVETIRAGDTVWIPPGEEHWHGARPDRMMCHLAIQEEADGRTADWLEPVTDAEYGAA